MKSFTDAEVKRLPCFFCDSKFLNSLFTFSDPKVRQELQEVRSAA